jgi:16S rRNA (cytidine1402-2'-O)-methyltransferase
MSKLYLVATPIGNLGDMSHRAVEVLQAVDFVICEDTRKSKVLLTHYAVQKPLTPLFLGNEKTKSLKIADRIAQGSSAALITDAGTPNISDPGYRLVEACLGKDIEVVSVPGPCALTSALSMSGLPTHSFVFEGFLPPKSGARLRKIKEWMELSRTIVFYESPHRVLKVLEEIKSVYGNVHLVIAREMTKKFEENRRALITDHISHFSSHPPKGEFVILLGAKKDHRPVLGR